jgi:adenylate cyclase
MPRHSSKKQYEESWYWYLTGQNKDGFSSEYERSIRSFRRISGLFPGQPRCFECDRPLSGLGSILMNTRPSSFSPRLCQTCEKSIKEEEAGAEVELSLLFADMRGSTNLAERMTTLEFKSLIQRFYQAVSAVLIEHNAMVNRLMGDQVIGLFVPRFAGAGHARVAVAAALDMLRATGHGDPTCERIPMGIGVHTGSVYVGAVGTNEGVNEIAVLGSSANLAARLCSQAADGEILVSETAAASARLSSAGSQERTLELKGFSQAITARVLRLDHNPLGET